MSSCSLINKGAKKKMRRKYLNVVLVYDSARVRVAGRIKGLSEGTNPFNTTLLLYIVIAIQYSKNALFKIGCKTGFLDGNIRSARAGSRVLRIWLESSGNDKPTLYLLPINNIPPRIYILRTLVLVLEVISMLPDVEGE